MSGIVKVNRHASSFGTKFATTRLVVSSNAAVPGNSVSCVAVMGNSDEEWSIPETWITASPAVGPSATVTIGGFVAAEDALAFTNQSGITGVFNASTGVLVVTGTALLASST